MTNWEFSVMKSMQAFQNVWLTQNRIFLFMFSLVEISLNASAKFHEKQIDDKRIIYWVSSKKTLLVFSA